MNSFGEYLNDLRKLENMTFRDMEEKTGISHSYLSQLANGKAKNPSLGVIAKISKVFGIPFELATETLENFLTETDISTKILSDVEAERKRQNVLWGVQRHHYGVWLSILGEEFGEVCEALQSHLGLVSAKESDASNLYDELIQLSAVAVAIAEQVKEESES